MGFTLNYTNVGQHITDERDKNRGVLSELSQDLSEIHVAPDGKFKWSYVKKIIKNKK